MVIYSKKTLLKMEGQHWTPVRLFKVFFFNVSFLEILFLLLFFTSFSLAQTTTATSSSSTISNATTSATSNDSTSVTSSASSSSATSFAASTALKTSTSQHADDSRFSIFFQLGIAFLGFDDRHKFQSAVDSIYLDNKSEAVNYAESLTVLKQDFQKVNFTFPIAGGIQIQHYKDHFISTGIGFIYNRESVVLTNRKNESFSYYYTLQAVPLFLEYRMTIPSNFITLSNQSLFSIAFRWYWMLPGTEIYTSWGKIEAEKSPAGHGFGLSLGYLITSYHSLRIYGDLGFTSISVSSKEPFSSIVPDASTEKAKWDLGGIQMQIRFSWGAIRIKEES